MSDSVNDQATPGYFCPETAPANVTTGRFTIHWGQGRYTVDVPNYNGGTVVPAAIADEMLTAHQENSRLLGLVLHDLVGRVEAGKLAAINQCLQRSQAAISKATGAA